jgi:hypothetical protein
MSQTEVTKGASDDVDELEDLEPDDADAEQVKGGAVEEAQPDSKGQHRG